jgi:hypothetical protein
VASALVNVRVGRVNPAILDDGIRKYVKTNKTAAATPAAIASFLFRAFILTSLRPGRDAS